MSIRSNSNRDTGTSYKVRPYASEIGVPSYSNYFVLETLNYKCSLFTSNQVCSLLLPPNTYCIRQLAHIVFFSLHNNADVLYQYNVYRYTKIAIANTCNTNIS